MDYSALKDILVPVLIGIFGAGGAGTFYYRNRSNRPMNTVEMQKVGAEASMIVIEGFQRLTDTLQKQCTTLAERVEALEKKSREEEELRVTERLEYKTKINSLEIELNSVISSSRYKDKQLDEQSGLITKLQERVTYLEGELRKYNATLL